jgi:HPt (histidine-containing phosphotransfer) domain-containing protein
MSPRSPLAIALVLGLLWPAAADAQARRYPGNGRNSLLFQSFFLGNVPMTIAAGHVVPTGRWQFGTWGHKMEGESSKEELQFLGNGVSGSVHYQRTTAEEHFVVELSSDGRFLLRHTPKGKAKGSPIELNQVPGAQITFTVGAGPQQTVYRAPTLWHLILLEPKACGEHLTPLLQPFPWSSQLTQIMTSLEAELVRLAGIGKIPSREQWAVMVRQLADNDYAKREAADRGLRGGGPAAASYLQQLDYAAMDAEQQFRIDRIIESFRGQTASDTTEQVAAMLAADPLVWLALLDRPQEATRRAAAKQLAALLGESIGIDPVADPATQKERREQLRAKLQQSKPETKPAAKPAR